VFRFTPSDTTPGWSTSSQFTTLIISTRSKSLEVSPKGQTLSPRAKLSPKDEDPLIAPPFFKTEENIHPRGWMKGWTLPTPEICKVHSRGPSSSLGASFTPGGKLMLLRSGPWLTEAHEIVQLCLQRIAYNICVCNCVLHLCITFVYYNCVCNCVLHLCITFVYYNCVC
jgi:hypothetical protein